uniref:Secreted protein n=1 Tax=Zea mays TaxID=4577 RepID=C4J6F6_MAIZE|nr:unknown [Zea mays]
MRSRRLRSASLWLLDAASALASKISCAVIRPTKSPKGDDEDAKGGGIIIIIPGPACCWWWCGCPM